MTESILKKTGILILLPSLLIFGAACQPKAVVNTTTVTNSNSTANRNTNSENLATNCTKPATPAQGEGPYYKANSPRTSDLRVEGVQGTPLDISGTVYDTNCQPLAGVWLDFWQTDGTGAYDNVGFKLRGHQFTDANGRYALQTVEPAQYPGRPQHIHVKLKRPDSQSIFTTQMFMTTDDQGTGEYINPLMVMQVTRSDSQTTATHDFVLQ